MPGELPWDQADLAIQHPRSQVGGLGRTAADGSPLPADAPAGVAAAADGPQRAGVPRLSEFPDLHGVEQLAELRDDAPPISPRASPARRRCDRGGGDTNGLDCGQIKELQRILAGRGYDVGKIDGLAGAKTRAAVKDMQIKLGLPADSYPTPELLNALRRGG